MRPGVLSESAARTLLHIRPAPFEEAEARVVKGVLAATARHADYKGKGEFFNRLKSGMTHACRAAQRAAAVEANGP